MVEVGVGASMEGQPSTAVTQPTPSTRRPRVREVSSRFMSPVSSYSSVSAGDLHLLHSKPSLSKAQPHQHQHQQQRSISAQRLRGLSEMEDAVRSTETTRSLDSPFPLYPSTPSIVCTQRKHQQQRGNTVNVYKHLKEDGNNGRFANKENYTSSRPDTPMLGYSRVRVNNRSNSNNITAATKLLQSSGIGMSPSTHKVHDDSSRLSSSDSEADLLPTVSSRILGERNTINRGSFKSSASPFSQSVNTPLSSCDPSIFHTVKGSVNPLSKSLSRSLRSNEGLCLPPVPPCPKIPTDTRKPKKVCSKQEDMHSLKLLYNHHMQWRFANVKAQVTVQAQKNEVERTLYSLGLEISDQRNSVKKKRLELELLRRMKTLSVVTESQMPYLESWSAIAEEYSMSLSETIQALMDASVQLPVSGNVKADTIEVVEAMKSATKLLETIVSNIQSFMPKAEEMQNLISELARVTNGESVLIGECGALFSKTRNMQVEESSLRGQLIQFAQNCRGKCLEDGK